VVRGCGQREKKLLVARRGFRAWLRTRARSRTAEKERVTRYTCGLLVAPDSKHLLFDSQGQLWLYSLETGRGTDHVGARRRARIRSSLGWQSHCYVGNTTCMSSRFRARRHSAYQRHRRQHPERQRLVTRSSVRQATILVAGRGRYRLSANGREVGCATYPITIGCPRIQAGSGKVSKAGDRTSGAAGA